jgi:glycosyltransferase involved in cell wall biosynthesis
MEAVDIPLLDDGKTGFVICQADEEAFEERVIQLLCDKELSLRTGLASRENAEREFGLGRLVEETLEVCKAAG